MTQQLLLHETLLKLQELSNNSNNIIIDCDEDDSMMPSARRRSSSRRQVRPAYTENKEVDERSLYYRPKSKREGSRGRDRSSLADISCSSRQLVVYGEEAPSSSKRNSCPVVNTRHNYRHDESDIALINGSCGDRDHSSSSSRHHYERPSGASRRRPSDQSLVSSINTSSTHPSTSNDGDDYLAVQDVDYDDYEDGYGQYMAYESKAPSSQRTASRSSSTRRRSKRSCSTKSRSRSSSSSHHQQQYRHDRRHDDAQHRSSYSPVRSRRRAPRSKRRSPDANQLRSSFASNGSQRSTRTLPTSSSSHDNRSSRPVPTRRRSSDDLRALEADDLRSIERAASHHRRRRSRSRRSGRNHRRRDDDSSRYSRHRRHRRSVSSSSSRRSDDPPADATVNLRISHSNTSQVIDGKTPRKQNSTKSNNKKKNSIDLSIDNNGQGTFQVVTSSSTQPLQFDIQIDEDQSSYLIQTSLGLLHQIREVHSPDTNILRTLTYWNSYFERQEVELGYHRGELGIVSTKSREMKQSVPKVPGGGGVRVKPTFAKQEVVLMTLTGVYHGGKAASFEMDDVFIKELELFVTDSLWCYLRLHGLKEDSSSKKKKDIDEDDLGNSHPEESNENVRNGSRGRGREESKNGRKKERVLSRVFKRVIGE